MIRMGKYKLTAAAALLASGVLTSAAMAGPAVPSSTVQGVANAASDNVTQIRDRGWRGRGWRHHRHGGWDGGGWGWGLAGLATGLALSAPYLADEGYGPDTYAYAGGGGVARCEATFKSFDPSSGTYVGYDGVRRMCPYL